MFNPKHIDLHQALLKEAEDKLALDPSLVKMLLAGGGGALAGGGIAHLLTQAHDER